MRKQTGLSDQEVFDTCQHFLDAAVECCAAILDDVGPTRCDYEFVKQHGSIARKWQAVGKLRRWAIPLLALSKQEVYCLFVETDKWAALQWAAMQGKALELNVREPGPDISNRRIMADARKPSDAQEKFKYPSDDALYWLAEAADLADMIQHQALDGLEGVPAAMRKANFKAAIERQKREWHELDQQAMVWVHMQQQEDTIPTLRDVAAHFLLSPSQLSGNSCKLPETQKKLAALRERKSGMVKASTVALTDKFKAVIESPMRRGNAARIHN